jgi:branched-chain amino acid aminotransferase
MSQKSIILNGNVITQEEYSEKAAEFYEVIRIKNRALLFLEDHITRLNHSLKMANIDKTFTIKAIQADFAKLFQADGIKNQNVKLSVSFENGYLNCALYYIDSVYLNENIYKKGVQVKTKSFERENPEIKQRTTAMQTIRKQLQLDNVYEYLLVDREGLILEGTKTNVFSVKGTQVITADTGRVLGGITRQHVADLARAHSGLTESLLAKTDLKEVEAVFLTGTSIGILPVSKVDDIRFNSANDPVVVSLMKAYEVWENTYITTHQLQAD